MSKKTFQVSLILKRHYVAFVEASSVKVAKQLALDLYQKNKVEQWGDDEVAAHGAVPVHKAKTP